MRRSPCDDVFDGKDGMERRLAEQTADNTDVATLVLLDATFAQQRPHLFLR